VIRTAILLAVLAGLAHAGEPDFYETPRVVAGRTIEVLRGDSLKTIIAAARPGDVIELHSGTYAAPGGLVFRRSGTPDAWIVLRGARGTRPTIDLAGGELAVGASYVCLENLEVVNGTGNNIHVVPRDMGSPLTCVVIRSVKSVEMGRGTGAALKIAGLWKNGAGAPCERVYVESCELAGSRDNALVDAVGVRRSVVRSCWLHDPMNLSMKSPGIFFKGGSTEILIEKNLVSGIHGNAAIMVGGDTGAKWFDALHAEPKLEGENEVVRNNVVAGCDDAAIELRGVRGAKILSNTIVVPSSFAIFRLTWGGGGSGSKIGNDDVEIANNLVVATGRPRYALNTGNEDVHVRFGPQLWAGRFAAAEGPGLPRLPGEQDVTAASGSEVLVDPRFDKLEGLADALGRFRPVRGSPAVGAGEPNGGAPRDAVDAARSRTPTIGALEPSTKRH
jgi:hypothetical protein